MQRLMNNLSGGIKGILLGALLGAICADVWGGIVGAIIGAFFINTDSIKTFKLPADFPMSARSLSLFFQCLGRFAKEDGRVSEEEAAFIKEQMLEWGFCDDTRKHLKQDFNIGRDSSDTFENLFEKFVSQLELAQNSFRCDLIHTFVSLAFSDGPIDYIKRSRLKYIANRLGRPDFLQTIMALFEGVYEDEERSHSHQQKDQNNHKEQRQYNSSRQASNSLDEYYKILGVPATATDDEVKKAWRKKAQEFHPDKVQGTGLSDAFVEYATEQIKKINEAYEKICAARKS